MNFRCMRAMMLAIVSSLILYATASAQPVATSFEELRSLVKPGETIHLTDANGRSIRGKIGDLSDSSLEVLSRDTTPGGRETFVPQRRLSESEVRQIYVQRSDPVWKGTIIGLAVAAWPAATVIAYGSQAARDNYANGEEMVGTGVVLFGVGAGIGALIDAAIKQRTMVYYRSPNQQSPTVQIVPRVTKSAAGIQLSLRF